MKIVLAVLILIILLVLLVLFNGIRYSVSAQIRQKTTTFVDISWIFRILRIRANYKDDAADYKIYIFGRLLPEKDVKGVSSEKPAKTPKKPKKKADSKSKGKRKKRKKQKNTLRNILEYEKLFECLGASWRLVSSLFKRLSPRKVRASGKFGFSEPYYTGLLLGAESMLMGLSGFDLKVLGEFSGEHRDVDLYICGKFSVFDILSPIVRFILYKPVRVLLFDRI
ncbi:hypothetical protein AGMMS49975_01450 [Clostridia bacterium]|nr:hypothetical protein AGMMS49975_01450 [Clostridia bacterium]